MLWHEQILSACRESLSKIFNTPHLTAAARGLAFDAAFWWATGLTALTLLPALLLPAVRRQTEKPNQDK
jgi:hypothetical protein